MVALSRYTNEPATKQLYLCSEGSGTKSEARCNARRARSIVGLTWEHKQILIRTSSRPHLAKAQEKDIIKEIEELFARLVNGENDHATRSLHSL